MAFECGICASMFNAAARQPLILECGHTFCRECIQHNLGPQRWCPYCRQPIHKHVDGLPRNYALENAMEAANVPLMDLMDRWGLANAERMMVKPDQLQLVNLISRKGNSGEVWRGSLWGKAVAIKLLPLVGVDERQLDCLRREVAVLLHTTGECKQVCIYKGFCVKGGNFAIIMKLYSYSLAARVARHPGRRLPLPLALKYCMDIAKGLVELHRLGVTAADLKPDNVLIDDELGDAVIADFGISSVVTCSIGVSAAASRGARRGREATRSSAVLRGTPNYMAPEQFTPGHRPTNKVDIWGFAATLLHMLTGAPPWAHDTLLQICTAVGVAKQSPPLPEGLPQQLEKLMRSCFEADPARRPTAVHILKALQGMGSVLERPQLLRTTQHLARNSQLLAAARGVLVGLQQDCSQLVQQLAEEEEAGRAAGSGHRRLQSVAEVDEGKQQQDEGNSLDGSEHSSSSSSKDDKQVALDQYLAQIGLLPLIGQESSLGAPSAPPLPGSNSSSSSMGQAAAGLGFKGRGHGRGDSGRSNCGNFVAGSSSRESSRPGSSLLNRSPSNKLPRVLWSEEEALQEEQEEQQRRRQQQQLQQQGAAASMGFTSPKRQPHHARSASEQVPGCRSAGVPWANDMECSSVQQQQSPPLSGGDQLQQFAAAAGTLDAISPKQQQHQRSASEGFEVWGGKAYGDSTALVGSSSSNSKALRKQVPGQLPTHFESPARSTTSSSCAAAEYELMTCKLGAGDKQQQQQQNCDSNDSSGDCFDSRRGEESSGSPGRQRKQWQIPAEHGEGQRQHQESQQFQKQQQEQPPSKHWTKEDQVKERAQQQIAALFGQNKWPGSSFNSQSGECSTAAAAADGPGHLTGPLTASASIHRTHAAVGSCSLAYPAAEQHSSGSSASAGTGLGVCDSPKASSPQKHQRTLSSLLLGRGGGMRGVGASSFPSETASSTADNSPDRLQQQCKGRGSVGSSILAGAGVGLAAGAAAAASQAAATAAGVAGAACLVGTAAAPGAAAAAAVAFGAAAEAGKVVAPGVVAALASKFSIGGGSNSSSRGTRNAASPSAKQAAAAAAPEPPSPGKGSRWRALFGGSPARKRPQTPQTSKTCMGPAAAAALNAGPACSSSSSARDSAAHSSYSASPGRGGPGGVGCSSLSNTASAALDWQRQQQQQQQQMLCGASTTVEKSLLSSAKQHQHSSQPGGVLGAHGAVPPAAGSPIPKLIGNIQNQLQQQSPGDPGCDSSKQLQSATASALQTCPSTCSVSGYASKSPSPGRSRPTVSAVAAAASGSSTCCSIDGEKLAPASPAAAAVAAAVAAAAQADGSCSPLKTHARKLSLPAKLQALSAAVQEQPHIGSSAAAAAAAAAARASPSPRCHQQRQCRESTAHATATQGRTGSANRLMAGGAAVASGEGQFSRSDDVTAQHTAAKAAAAAGLQQASSILSEQQPRNGMDAAHAGSCSGDGSGGGSSSCSAGGSHSQLLAEATQLEGLARQLSLSGRSEEAEAALRSSRAILTQQLGAAHPSSIASSTRLAMCLNKNGKAAEAEGLFRQVLTHKQAVLGRKHPQVGIAANNLAACLYGQGSYAAAAKMYAVALDVRKASLGEQHADTAASMSNLALCKSRLGQFADAEGLYQQALSVRSSVLGQVHPDVAATAHQLGHCLSQLGRHSEALLVHKQGLWVRQQLQQSPTQPSGRDTGCSSSGGSQTIADDVAASHRSVGLSLVQLGCDSQAEEHLGQVLEARTAEVLTLDPPPPPGRDSPAAAGAGRHSRQASFAAAAGLNCFGAVEDHDVDWSILEEGDSRLTKQQQDALLAMAAAAEDLGRCYSRQGKHSDAEELYWQALEARSQVLGARHELVQATEEQLRDCLDRQC